MKKITFLLIALLVAMVSYSQVHLIDEEFTGNSLPAGWVNNSPPGNGTQLWTFGSGNMPGSDVNDFTSNAAIFNDNAAGAAGTRNIANLYYVGSNNGVDVSSYLATGTNLKLELSVNYALNTFASDSAKDAFQFIVWNDVSNSWEVVFNSQIQSNPHFTSIDLGAVIAGMGLDLTHLKVGVRFDDKNGSVGWGAGVDHFILKVRPYNDRSYDSQAIEVTSFPYTNTQLTDGNLNITSFATFCSPGMNDGVWYWFTAPTTGKITVSAKADDFDLEIGVYEDPASGVYTCVNSVDDTLTGDYEYLTFDAVSGKKYKLNFGHYSSTNDYLETGNLKVNIAYTPDNDECYNATNVTSFPYNIIQNISGTTNLYYVIETGCGTGMNDGVWYTFTAPETGEFNIVADADFDLEIGVYTGTCGTALECVDNSDSASVNPESLTINVSQGVEYFINLGHYSNSIDFFEFGDLTLSMNYTPPVNDDCVDATTLTVGTNFDQHYVLGEFLGYTPTSGITSISCIDNYGFGNGSDIWYNLIVPNNGAVTIETAAQVGSLIADTVLTAYTGSCANLQEIACNDDGAIGLFTKLDITGLTPGDILFIRVSEYHTNQYGEFKISAYNVSTAAIDNDIIGGLSLYPNPINDVLHIEAQDNITSLLIYNQLGQIVKKTKPNQAIVAIDVSDLSSGIYIVKIEADDKVSSKRVIKK